MSKSRISSTSHAIDTINNSAPPLDYSFRSLAAFPGKKILNQCRVFNILPVYAQNILFFMLLMYTCVLKVMNLRTLKIVWSLDLICI